MYIHLSSIWVTTSFINQPQIIALYKTRLFFGVHQSEIINEEMSYCIFLQQRYIELFNDVCSSLLTVSFHVVCSLFLLLWQNKYKWLCAIFLKLGLFWGKGKKCNSYRAKYDRLISNEWIVPKSIRDLSKLFLWTITVVPS